MSESKYFFNPHLGNNHKNRLVLLATTGCCHSDCHHYNQCTNGIQKDWSDCPYQEEGNDGQSILLSNTVPHMVDKFINDHFEYEKRYKTFSCLTNAISLSYGGNKIKRWEKEKIRDIWGKFICTELCQHFIGCTTDKRVADRNSVETKYDDFGKSNSFDKLLSLLDELQKKGIIISKIMILGKPSFTYLKNCCKERHIEFSTVNEEDGYWHKLFLNDREIEVLYTWHPSYSRYYDKRNGSSRLITELEKFFSG